MTTALVAKGSIQEVVKGGDTAIALLDAQIALVCDRSSSMLEVARSRKRRFEIEDEVVVRLQARYPGQVALASFSEEAELQPSGILPPPQGGTNMIDALRLIEQLSQIGLKCVLISDGEPNDEYGTIAYATQIHVNFDVIFVGPETSGGAVFLRKLCNVAKGAFHVNDLAKDATLLEQTIVLMLESGRR